MAESLHTIVTDDDEILERGLTLEEAEIALCRAINNGYDAYIGDEEPTPLGGRSKKNPDFCRCEGNNAHVDCGCGFGQCEKGLIY